MPCQHPRRSLRKAAHALGVGTLAIARSASASWHNALVEQRCPAYLNSPFLGARSSSRGNCYNSNRAAESLGALSRTPPPAVVTRALTMDNSDDRKKGAQGRFGGGNAHQRGPPSGGASGPLKATSVLLHDEPVRAIIQ